ncbi:hypothetical protein PQR34_45140 [Paraburkholderia sediminicola]|uniref:hypothetical protein n=1 Tax=Paraburkholderia sediminicola TaxID=458836 RepID=UPI0038BADD5A
MKPDDLTAKVRKVRFLTTLSGWGTLVIRAREISGGTKLARPITAFLGAPGR